LVILNTKSLIINYKINNYVNLNFLLIYILNYNYSLSK